MKNVTKVFILSGLAFGLSACSNFQEPDYAWCSPYEKQTVVEEVNLVADALFKFDKSDSKDLLEKGRKTLDELADKIKSGYATVEQIDLVGHTDRLGTEKYNYDLGLRRAETVKAYLENSGIKVPMTVSSAGENQPVTQGCEGEVATQALTQCLLSDRRVAVRIKAVKKGEK